jgi:aryl-alcohol dehydrogenase-like predicted oxidoreductase
MKPSPSPPEKRRLGKSNLYVSEIGIGANTFGPPRLDKAESARVVHAALDMGVNFVDTAIVYGQGKSEEFLGEALASRRDEMIIATKFMLRTEQEGSIRDRITTQAETSLRKLGSDRIDLYQIHLPYPSALPAEILDALEELVKAGKVLAIGACNYSSWRLDQAAHVARARGVSEFVTVQNYYNLLDRSLESEVVPWCEEFDVSILPYHPLAGGFLTGKYLEGQPPPPGTRGAAGSPMVNHASSKENYVTLRELEAFSNELGHTIGELAIAWLLANPHVGCVIAGVSNPEQLEANVRASSWKLSAEQKAAVDAITGGPLGRPSNPERPPYA